MSKRVDDPNAQLSLDLFTEPSATITVAPVINAGTVVPFVDASTIAARRAAIARVRSSGIFNVPSRMPLEG